MLKTSKTIRRGITIATISLLGFTPAHANMVGNTDKVAEKKLLQQTLKTAEVNQIIANTIKRPNQEFLNHKETKTTIEMYNHTPGFCQTSDQKTYVQEYPNVTYDIPCNPELRRQTTYMETQLDKKRKTYPEFPYEDYGVTIKIVRFSTPATAGKKFHNMIKETKPKYLNHGNLSNQKNYLKPGGYSRYSAKKLELKYGYTPYEFCEDYIELKLYRNYIIEIHMTYTRDKHSHVTVQEHMNTVSNLLNRQEAKLSEVI